MNIDSVLNYKKDSSENYYEILGCTQASSPEQIISEYKARVKNVHPDKQKEELGDSIERFQKLSLAKSILTDESKRKNYDNWLNSGMAMSYNDWCGLNDSAKRSSMHWGTPKMEGRCIESVAENEELQPSTSKGEAPKIKESDLYKSTLSKKRSMFASSRQESSFSSMVITEKVSDEEMRRRFRNYEI